MKQRDDDNERRRDTERLLLQQVSVNDRHQQQQQQLWPNRSLSNPLELLAVSGVHTAQRAVSTAAADFQLDADF